MGGGKILIFKRIGPQSAALFRMCIFGLPECWWRWLDTSSSMLSASVGLPGRREV